MQQVGFTLPVPVHLHVWHGCFSAVVEATMSDCHCDHCNNKYGCAVTLICSTACRPSCRSLWCASSWPLVLSAHQEFKYKKQLIILSDDLLELHNVWVIQLAQAFDLTQVHAFLPGVELALHLLDSDLRSEQHNMVYVMRYGNNLW